MKRKRGRPRKFQGVKDRKTFPGQLSAEMPPVIEFLVEWKKAQLLPKRRGVDRRDQALQAVAMKHGLSPRTFERRIAALRFLAEPLADIALQGSQESVPLVLEYFPEAD